MHEFDAAWSPDSRWIACTKQLPNLINQFAGSGGDALPWYFEKMGIGPLVGVRTWGGPVGIGGYPTLMDGGSVTAPRWAIDGLDGHWEVEGHGIAPDIAVEQDPKAVREGRDAQLERAVQAALDLLAKNPPKTYPRPAHPTARGCRAAAGESGNPAGGWPGRSGRPGRPGPPVGVVRTAGVTGTPAPGRDVLD